MQGVQLRFKIKRGKNYIVSNMETWLLKEPSSKCIVVYQLESMRLIKHDPFSSAPAPENSGCRRTKSNTSPYY